jgi:hypothetical protein
MNEWLVWALFKLRLWPVDWDIILIIRHKIHILSKQECKEWSSPCINSTASLNLSGEMLCNKEDKLM